MDEKKNNQSPMDFDLDEIKASVDKVKKEVSESFDKLSFDLTPDVPDETSEATNTTDAPLETETEAAIDKAAGENAGGIQGETFTMTPSDPEVKNVEGEGFTMTPSEEDAGSIQGESFTMKPSDPEVKSVEGEGFTMTPNESKKENIDSAGEIPDMKPDTKEDASEALEKDFGKIDEAPMKDAMDARDQALRDSVDSFTFSPVTEKKSNDGVSGPEISASTTVVDGEAAPARSASVRTPSSAETASPSSATRSSSYGRSSSSPGGSHYASEPKKPQKEKRYVTRGTLIGCMILTMILSTLLGSLLGGGLSKSIRNISNYDDENRAEREDSKLSELNLSDATGSELTVAQIVDKNENAVVEIIVSGTTQGMWGQLQLAEGAGSGVIIREDGYIATNYHVIQGANKVQVTLRNGKVYPASIVGSDPSNDVAVIKIDESGLTTAEIGDSSKVDVGDLAVAIGNPLGQLGGSVTTGIISALDRTLTVEGTTLTLLQTDAAINGGNSGGGLFNARGELIGIVESKASAVGVEGLGFALPINSVAEILNDIIASGGDVSGQSAGTPAVGVVISEVSEEQSEYYGLDSPGVYIAQVTGENAMRAGFQEQDRIVSFNGTEITNSSEFIALVRKCKVGDTVTVVVSRNGQEIEIKTELEELQMQ